MRKIEPTLTPELKEHCGKDPLWQSPAFPISTFRALVEHVARLAYANSDWYLFFRGQGQDYESKAGGTTLYPSIYRGDALQAQELRHRFEMLDQAGRLLTEKFKAEKIEGHPEISRKKYIQWSILQHYEIVATPLLDLTQSLRVACSFAQLASIDSSGYVYLLGLPYVTNRISVHSEHDIANVRLLSICPPSALRPYFQEAYLAATADITTEYDSKTELDFRNRLIAKFAIPRLRAFWGAGFEQIPQTALFPKGDRILDLCKQVKSELRDEQLPGDLGTFIKDWAILEERLLETARQLTSRNVSVREAIVALTKQGLLTPAEAQQLELVRRQRNYVVHQPKNVTESEIKATLPIIREWAMSNRWIRLP